MCLVSPRRAEKVGLRPRRKHQKISLICLSLSRRNGAGDEIDRDNLRHFHVHIGVGSEDTSQTESRIARRQFGGGHLVEQRLELLVIVLVEQGNPNISMRSQLTGAVQTGKTATDDHDVLQLLTLHFTAAVNRRMPHRFAKSTLDSNDCATGKNAGARH